MNVQDLLIELYGRIPAHVRAAVDGLSATQLAASPEPGSNSVGWLVWHLTRVQDHHVAELLDIQQLWVGGHWHQRFGLPVADPDNTGYGHSRTDMERIRPDSGAVLVDYYDAVASRTNDFLRQLTPAALDQVVDERWDPPVTLGVRLVSVADDDIQHAGQATYLRGLLHRRDRHQ